MKLHIPLLFILLFSILGFLNAQEVYLDESIRLTIDSLDNRIVELNRKIKNYGADRDAGYFRSKRELDMTAFIREYEELVFNEDLVQAQNLIDSRIKASQKRFDSYAVGFYSKYKTTLTRLRGRKRAHYQLLFAKEKNFKKEYQKYIKPANDYAYNKTLRMLDLAIKYAEETGRDQTLIYLLRYEKFTRALLFDLHSNYDLKKLTSSETYFQKVFEPLIENDSLSTILEGKELVEKCYDYSSSALSKLDTVFFAKQKIVVANALADWNERQGLSTVLADLTGQSVVARRDTVNREGIYQWNDLIVVIGSVSFDSKSEHVRRGEAIIDADRTLFDYIRVNKISKVNKTMKLGKTYLLPVDDNDKVSYFRYDHEKQAWQYMVAYSSVISEKFTEQMGKFLPPLQFQDKISGEVQ